MTEYTLRIAGKRQVTLPEEIVTALNLQKGDELGIVVHTPSDIRLIPYTRVRKDLLTPEIEDVLRKRRKEIEGGQPMVSLEDVLKKAGKSSVRRVGGFSKIEAKAKAPARARIASV